MFASGLVLIFSEGGLKHSVKPKNPGDVAAGEVGVSVVCFRWIELVAGNEERRQASDFGRRRVRMLVTTQRAHRVEEPPTVSLEFSALQRHLTIRPLNWNDFSVVAWIDRFQA